jgi:hypothetical protein
MPLTPSLDPRKSVGHFKMIDAKQDYVETFGLISIFNTGIAKSEALSNICPAISLASNWCHL